VGRSKESNICIPDLLTSKNHAVISFYEGYGFFVKDAGSRHGTFVDGLKLTRPTAASTSNVTAGNSHVNSRVGNENSSLVNAIISDIRHVGGGSGGADMGLNRNKRRRPNALPEEELEEGEIVEEVGEGVEDDRGLGLGLGSGSALQEDEWARVNHFINVDNEMQSDNFKSHLGSDQSDQFKSRSDKNYCYLYDGAILSVGRIQLKFTLERQSAVLSKSFESSTSSSTSLLNSSSSNSSSASQIYSISNGSEVKRHQMIISGQEYYAVRYRC
jgi:hypothetical protein